jgi:hypothetical protein
MSRAVDTVGTAECMLHKQRFTVKYVYEFGMTFELSIDFDGSGTLLGRGFLIGMPTMHRDQDDMLHRMSFSSRERYTKEPLLLKIAKHKGSE